VAIIALAGASRQIKKAAVPQTQFYGRPSGSSDANVRAKAVEQMVAALDKVAQEGGTGEEVPETGSVAAAVEQELFALYGIPPHNPFPGHGPPTRPSL
jgi:hypothetical protein